MRLTGHFLVGRVAGWRRKTVSKLGYYLHQPPPSPDWSSLLVPGFTFFQCREKESDEESQVFPCIFGSPFDLYGAFWCTRHRGVPISLTIAGVKLGCRAEDTVYEKHTCSHYNLFH